MYVAGFESRTVCMQNRGAAETAKTPLWVIMYFIDLDCYWVKLKLKLKLKLKIVTNVKVDSFVVFYGGP